MSHNTGDGAGNPSTVVLTGNSSGPAAVTVPLSQVPDDRNGTLSLLTPGNYAVQVSINDTNNRNSISQERIAIMDERRENANQISIDNIVANINTEPMEFDGSVNTDQPLFEPILGYAEWLRQKKIRRNSRSKKQYDAYRTAETQRRENGLREREVRDHVHSAVEEEERRVNATQNSSDNNTANVEPMEVDSTVNNDRSSVEPLLSYTEWLRQKKMGRNRRSLGQYNAYCATETQRQEQLIRHRERQRERRHAMSDFDRDRLLDEQNALRNDIRAESSRDAATLIRDRNNHQANYAETQAQRRLENLFNAEATEVEPFRLGKMDVVCSSCGSMHFKEEMVTGKTTFNDCCNHGKVAVDLEKDFPEELKALFKRDHQDPQLQQRSKLFHEDIMKLNYSLSFATMIDRHHDTTLPGIFHYRIQGEVEYAMDRYIDPMPNYAPLHGQLWVIETDDAIEYRMRDPRQTSSRPIHDFLHNLFQNNNEYAKIYQTLGEEEALEKQRAAQAGVPPRALHIKFRKVTDNASDPNALPHTVNEIAGIYVSDENGIIPWNDIRVQRKRIGNEPPMCHIVNRNSEHVEPLTFVLFNPTGKGDFWFTRKPKIPPPPGAPRLTTEKGSMSPLRYYMYKLSDRPESEGHPFNPLLYGGKLLSKYLIHAYSAVEHNRITWIRANQKTIRVDTYAGLQDYINNFSNENNVDPGRVVVLPSSFSQGPRCQSERFHDAMASVKKNGSPDLFLTMTCNPKHDDIMDNLKPGQKPSDRPDLVDRVFNLQTKQLVREMKSGLFGTVKHYIIVVEFQKRGLPHIHSLWTFKENDWHDVNKIDRFISAEIPNKEVDPLGNELVCKHLLHGLCGTINRNAMCMRNGRCKYKFPKNFADETTTDTGQYPDYRRRATGVHIMTKFQGVDYPIDNRYVVPHNMYLLKRFRCHLNVEVVSSLSVVTYLYKYLFKGPDSVQIEVHDGRANYDEVTTFLQARYMGAHEAFYRICEYLMHFNSEVMERMPVHLPEQQVITLRANADYQAAIEASMKSSKLLACFKLNSTNPNGKCKDLTYPNLCHSYTWNSKETEWSPRKNTPKPKCPRLYVVDPKKTELFYLRKLLMIVKGPKSYEHLRTDPNDPTIVYQTFREACVARGLVVSDQMYIEALEEGILHVMPRQLRSLFARIVAHCDVEHPYWIWCQYRKELCSDLLRKYRGDMDLAEQHGLRHVLRSIRYNERDLNDYPILILVSQAIGGLGDDTVNIDVHRIRANRMQDQLNPEQKVAFDAVMNSVENPSSNGNCFFVNGPGGSGKTFLFNCIYSTTLAAEKKVIIMAWSGIAASLYAIGRTCHNVFKLDYPFLDDSNSGVKPNDCLGRDLLAVDVIIWDEAPMAPKRALEVIDTKLQEITGNNTPFGGKIMVLGGDFCQLPPVVKNGTKNDILRNSIKSSFLWEQLFTPHTFKLVQNQRANAEANSFPQDICNIGNGTVGDATGKVELPQTCISHDDLVNTVFGDVINTPLTSSRAILCTLNRQVYEYNEKVMDLLDVSTERVYVSQDRVEETNVLEVYTPEYFETFRPSGFPAHTQRYRKGAIVMLMRNLNIREGLCNGTRLRILDLSPNLIVAEKLNSFTDDDAEYETDEDRINANKVMIPRITLHDDSTAFTLYRHQFPLRSAFAITINKSQGQTFEKIGVDLSSRIFSHGHLYVALSRTRAWNCISLRLPDEGNLTDNIVYPELLLDQMPPLPLLPIADAIDPELDPADPTINDDES